MKQQIEALRDFLRRYRQAFAEYWSIRHQLDPKPRSEDELAFLPAHLELTDSPVSPLPRWSMRVIVALCLCMFLWALIGQLDIVAVAGGKTVSGGRTKIIQPLEPSVVKAIHVRDGQLVKAGQLLIELDATAAGADNRKAGDALETARLAAARYQALLAALDNGRLPQLEKLDGVDPAKQLSEETLAVGQWRAYQAKREALQATLRQREAELSTPASRCASCKARRGWPRRASTTTRSCWTRISSPGTPIWTSSRRASSSRATWPASKAASRSWPQPSPASAKNCKR